MPKAITFFTDGKARPPQPLSLRLDAIRLQLLAMDEARTVSFFELKDVTRLLKSTISLCPDCLAHVPAIVFTRENRVLMCKRCSIHGTTEAVLENDESFYHLSNKDRWGRRFAEDKVVDFPAFEGGCCGEGGCCSTPADGLEDFSDQWSNKSCTILVEITNACNLACPVCYSDAKGDRKLPLAQFQAYLLNLIQKKGGLDSVQLTGGEALLHPEFWEMVAFLHQQSGIKKIYLPTNGIALAVPETAAKLLPYRSKLMVLLQFDGEQAETNRALRDANTTRVRDRVIENLSALGIHMQLTMTITRDVNDQEIGWVVEVGLRHPSVKVIALQPVTYSGRYQLTQDPLQRLTLSDIVKGVSAQIHIKTRHDDFSPIPCSHPNCGWITLFVRRFGLTLNIARHIDLDRAMNQVANRTLLNTSELRSVVSGKSDSIISRIGAWAGRKLIRSTDVFGIAIKPFMDRFNYDQDRISACCHHLLDTQGRPVSFCEYNARIRQKDPWTEFPLLKNSS